MALETNVQAAREVARQMRLRNLSGIIIVDFIDMEQENDRMTVLKVLNEEIKKDKAKTAVMGFTKLGLVEITRKRTSPPVEELLFEKCPVCHGEGLVLSPKRILKMISDEMDQAKGMKDINGIYLNLHWSLSGYLNKEWRESVLEKTKFESMDIDFTRKDPNGYDIKYKKKA
jgi:ribonuclease G